MNKFITKCPKCGSKNFIIDEAIVWVAEVDDNGDLAAFKTQNNEILSIFCRDCEHEVSSNDFNQINF